MKKVEGNTSLVKDESTNTVINSDERAYLNNKMLRRRLLEERKKKEELENRVEKLEKLLDQLLDSKKEKINFKLSNNSLSHLEGVHPDLVRIVKFAIKITEIDFGVIDGLRTIEEQRKNFEEGKTKTMESKHLVGEAVDVLAYIGNDHTWDNQYYIKIADAFRTVAIQECIKIRWGGCWSILNNESSAKDAQDKYIKRKKKEGKKPFIDGSHFEIILE